MKHLGFKNRGVKIRTDLSILKKTKSSCILVECCFVDDKDDVKLYDPKTMAKAIAQGILNKTIEDKKTTDEYYRVIAGSFRKRHIRWRASRIYRIIKRLRGLPLVYYFLYTSINGLNPNFINLFLASSAYCLFLKEPDITL